MLPFLLSLVKLVHFLKDLSRTNREGTNTVLRTKKIITMLAAWIIKIIEYYEQLFLNKFRHSDEIDKFFGR